MRLRVLLLIALVALPACPASRARTVRLIDGRPQATRYVSPNAYHHFLRAEIALTRGKPVAAARELRKALAFDSNSPYLHTKLAHALTRAGNTAAAELHVTKALTLRPGFPDALLTRSALAARARRYADAERALRQCIAANPTFEAAYVRLAALLDDRDRSDEARRLLQTMIKRLPRQRRGYRSLALVCLRQLDYRCAVGAYARALQLRTDLDTLMRLAHVLRSMGKLAEATRLLREAFDRSGAHISVGLPLMQALRDAGKTRQIDDLVGVLERAAGSRVAKIAQVVELALRASRPRRAAAVLAPLRARFAREPMLRIANALVLDRLGKHARAVRMLRRELAGAQSARAARNLAQVLVRAKKRAAATKVLRAAHAKHPGVDVLTVALADELYHASRTAEAVGVVRAALAARDTRTLRFALATALERSGRWRDAIKALEPLIRKNPRDAAAHNFIGYTRLEHGGDIKRAEREIRRALRLRPGAGYIMDSLGWLFFKQKRYARAERALTYAMRVSPGEPEIIEHLAEVNAALKRLPRAITLLRRALKASKDRVLSARLRRRIEALRAGRIGQRPRKTR